MVYFIAKYEIEGTITSTLGECYSYCKDKKYLGLDIETSKNPEYEDIETKVYKGGLDPYLSNIVLLQIGDLNKQFVIDVRDFSNEELSPILGFIHMNEEVTFVGQNLKFEVKHLWHKYGINLSKVHDTMICEIILHNGEPGKLGLADLAVKYLNKKKASDFNLFNLPDNAIISLDENELSEGGRFISPFDIAEGKVIDKATRLEFITIGSKPVTFKQIEYAADDIIDPILICSKQLKGRVLHDGTLYQPKKSFRLENSFIPLLGEMEMSGMYFNESKWVELADKYTTEMTRVELILNTYVTQNHPKYAGQYDLFSGEVDCKIQWTSSKQVVKFFKYLDICPRAFSKQTMKVEDTVGAKELLKQIPLDYVGKYHGLKEVEIVTPDDFTLMFLIFKKYEQLSTTFGMKWLKYVHPLTKRVHPSYVQLVNTGRMACNSPNIQQIPSGSNHRDAFTVQKDNEWLINADFSNMEVRVIADKANETFMLNFFNNGDDFFGDDLHSYTATLIERTKYGEDAKVVQPKELPSGEKNTNFTHEDSELRGRSKSITFGLAFGKGARGFADEFRISEEEAEDFMDNYYEAYPGLKDWFQEQHSFYQKNGFVVIEPYTDFRWFNPMYVEHEKNMQKIKDQFPRDYYKLSKEKRTALRMEIFEENPELGKQWKAYWRDLGAWKRKSQNSPVQGTAARINKVAGLYIREKLIESGEYMQGVSFMLNQHDEWICNYTDNKNISKEEVATIIEDSMSKAGGIFNKRVKHIGKAEIIKEWAH